MSWIETITPDEAAALGSAMWGFSWTKTPEGGMTGKVNGEGLFEGDRFWADAIRDTHDQPALRLEMAKRHLPLPAAFREAAIALRALIRARRKDGEPFESELRELHGWAAIETLSSYDGLEATPFAKVAALDLGPEKLGWDELPLLNKTDRKLMGETWPAPAAHRTALQLYPSFDREARAVMAVQRESERERRLAEFHAEIDAIMEEEAAEAALAASQKSAGKRGFFARLFGNR